MFPSSLQMIPLNRVFGSVPITYADCGRRAPLTVLYVEFLPFFFFWFVRVQRWLVEDRHAQYSLAGVPILLFTHCTISTANELQDAPRFK
jgi:hypothetical protein